MLNRWRRLATWTVCLLGIGVWIFLNSAQYFPARAEECSCNNEDGKKDEQMCNQEKISCLQSKISEKQSQAQSLSNMIGVLNNQISVQELQIRQTQLEIARLVDEVEKLGNRISGLNTSLDRMSLAMIERVSESYKRREADPFFVLLRSDSLEHFFSKYKYLQLAQQHTTDVMKQAETQKLDYDQQKTLKEQKQREIEQKRQLLQAQQNQLTQQRSEQQVLLERTKNDEKRYQEELAAALAESGAISDIVAGKGEEVKIRDVKEGDKIATILQGRTPCSTATHLHFEVVKDGTYQSPTSYLKSIPISWSNQPDGPFSFSGDWNWPLNDPARVTQGFGMTCFARPGCYSKNGAYNGAPHTGIDMVSKDGNLNVKAVKDGVLYAGAIECDKKSLYYVKVEHKDSNLSTLYLHTRLSQ